MARVTMKELLEAGVHFGHLTRRWNPKMKPYIYGERNGIYIIDLHQTLKGIEAACDFVNQVVSEGKPILFVGTKKQAQESIAAAAQRCGMFYVTQRWLGGMLTNWQTIRQRIQRLRQLREMEKEGMFEVLPKKEATRLQEEREKLELVLGGIEEMPALPGALFIVDTKEEHIAVREARRLHIPIIAIVDTNCDPDEVDYIIPGNDDAIRAIKLISDKIAEAVLEVREGPHPELTEAVPEAGAEAVAPEEEGMAAEELAEYPGELEEAMEEKKVASEEALDWPEEEEEDEEEEDEEWPEDEKWSEDEEWSEDEDEDEDEE